MAILNQKRILNLIPKTSAPVTIHVSQGDVGTEIEFTLVKGDELFVNPGNVSASVHGVREDGANFGAFTCTLSGSSVKFPLHAEMTAVKGSALAEIVIVDNDGNKVGSANFAIMVEESVFPLGVTYDNDVSVYESILAYAQTIPAQIQGEIADLGNDINSLNEALANEATARAAADATLGARIDELIAPSGEAPSAAEVTDARIGADGKVYNSLGTAIRTQISGLSEETYNLWTNESEYSFTRRVMNIPLSLPAGTYTFSAYITSDDTEKTENSVLIYYDNDNYVPIKLERNKQAYTRVTFENPIVSVTLFASTASYSVDKSATYRNIMIYSGSDIKPYVPNTSAKDYIARRISDEHEDNIVLLQDSVRCRFDDILFETGCYNYMSGAQGSSAMEVIVEGSSINVYGVRSKGFINEEQIASLHSSGSYIMFLLAYQSDDTSYIGWYNGTNFVTTKYNADYALSVYDVFSITETYTTYRYKLVIFDISITTQPTVENTLDTIYYIPIVKKYIDDNIQTVNNEIQSVNNKIAVSNCIDVAQECFNFNNATVGNVSFSWNETKTICTVSSDEADTTNRRLYLYRIDDVLPEGIIPGSTVFLRVDITGNVSIHVAFMNSSAQIISDGYYIKDEAIVVPSDTVGLRVSIFAEKELIISGTVSNLKFYNSYSNVEMTELLTSAGLDKYPYYYQSQLDTKIPIILENMERVGRHGFTFAFITDPHWDKNYRHSPALLREIMNKVGLTHVICGGDLILVGTKSYAENMLLDCINAFKIKGITFPVLYGNHDGNRNFQPEQSEELSENAVWALIESQYDKRPVVYFTETGFNYYIDYIETNTRLIMLDSGDEQIINDVKAPYFTEWEACCDIIAASKDKNIIIFVHAVASVNNGNHLVEIANAFNARESVSFTKEDGNSFTYDFSTVVSDSDLGRVYIVIGGHGHSDYIRTPAVGGISWVMVDTDGSTTHSLSGAVEGTVTEQAFDVVTVDYETGTTYFVRIGRGSDRTVSVQT